VPDVGPGRAQLSISQSIVYPHECDQYGCYDTVLNANTVWVDIAEDDSAGTK